MPNSEGFLFKSEFWNYYHVYSDCFSLAIDQTRIRKGCTLEQHKCTATRQKLDNLLFFTTDMDLSLKPI